MKYALALFMILLTGSPGEKPDKQKFQVVYKIQYNAITLEEASKIEDQIKEDHSTARVSVEVSPMSNLVIGTPPDIDTIGYIPRDYWDYWKKYSDTLIVPLKPKYIPLKSITQ